YLAGSTDLIASTSRVGSKSGSSGRILNTFSSRAHSIWSWPISVGNWLRKLVRIRSTQDLQVMPGTLIKTGSSFPSMLSHLTSNWTKVGLIKFGLGLGEKGVNQ